MFVGDRKVKEMTVGERICKRRTQLNMTQEELAFKMGYKTRNAIYQYEKAENMKLSLIEKFANVLDCDVAYLMGWQETPKKPIEEQLADAYIHGDNTIELVKSFNELNEEQQRQIVLMLAFFKSQNEDK